MDLSALLSSSSFSNTTLLTQISAQLQKNAQKQAQVVGDQYSQQISALQNAPDAVNAAKSQKDISSAVDNLTQTVNTLQQMSSTLDNMSSLVANIGGGTTSTVQTMNFDSQWSMLNSLSQGGGSDNLLGTVTQGGDYRPNSISYQAANGSTVSIQGAYLGTDYKVQLNDGSFFMPSGTQMLQKYVAYPLGTSGYGQSTAPGNATLQSPVGSSSVSFTLGANLSASSQTSYTGTVQRQGLGVLNSWLYNNFSTPSDQAKAEQDIAQAKSQVTFMMARYNGMLAMAQNDQTAETALQNSITNKVNDLQSQAQTAMKKVSDDAQRQLNAIQTSFATAQSTSASTTALSGLFSALVPSGGPTIDALASGGTVGDSSQSPQQQWQTMQQDQFDQAVKASQNSYATALNILT